MNTLGISIKDLGSAAYLIGTNRIEAPEWVKASKLALQQWNAGWNEAREKNPGIHALILPRPWVVRQVPHGYPATAFMVATNLCELGQAEVAIQRWAQNYHETDAAVAVEGLIYNEQYENFVARYTINKDNLKYSGQVSTEPLKIVQ